MATAENQAGGAPAPGSTELYYYEKIYPKKITGRFRSIKTWLNSLLLAIFFIGPWIRWDRGPNAPDQAIFIDMNGRKAYFFFIEIWPQEVYYLTGLLVIAAIVLFFA
ncbi:MAG: cytochrome c oxidase accessory protein CcoG, partial [Rhodospirillaceae bacterium]